MLPCVSSTSVSSLGLSGSPMHGTAPLTGKSGLSNAFAGVLEPSRTLCACMRTLCVPGQLSSPSVLPGHGLMLLGESGSFEFAGHAQILSCVSPAVFVCVAMQYVSACTFSVPTRLLGLTLLQQLPNTPLLPCTHTPTPTPQHWLLLYAGDDNLNCDGPHLWHQ